MSGYRVCPRFHLMAHPISGRTSRRGCALAHSLIIIRIPRRDTGMARKAAVAPKITGEQARLMRQKSGANQSDFWKQLGVTQSGGSRYESGRSIPAPVRLLLALRYGSAAQRRQAGEFVGLIEAAVEE
jgi:DNA-binding transcriptional regulator YiaG